MDDKLPRGIIRRRICLEMEENLLARLAHNVVGALGVQRVVGRIAGTVEGAGGVAETECTPVGAPDGFAGNAKVFKLK
jgi:hypothetical protein